MKNDILALIPARGGSKGVPGKNIKLLGGYPLIAYSICASRLSKDIARTVVSTDSTEIADIARRYGAEGPFMRPPGISQDDSTDLELFQHAINWFDENEKQTPRIIVHLRPTTPFREPSKIDNAIDSIEKNINSTSLRSAHELAEPPHKEFQLDERGFFKGFFSDDNRLEYYNLPRQLFPKAYHANGYVDIIKTDVVKKTNLLHGSNILGFITPVTTEVDKEEDFEYLEYQLEKQGSLIHDYMVKNFPKES